MNFQLMMGFVLAGLIALPAAAAPDEAAAKAYGKKNDCFKCHAVAKTKKGPSYKKIAAKYVGQADADVKLFEHLTVSKKVKLEDGSEEDHKALDKGEVAAIKNLIGWIRAQ